MHKSGLINKPEVKDEVDFISESAGYDEEIIRKLEQQLEVHEIE